MQPTPATATGSEPPSPAAAAATAAGGAAIQEGRLSAKQVAVLEGRLMWNDGAIAERQGTDCSEEGVEGSPEEEAAIAVSQNSSSAPA
jgi:hypothetical protein